MAKLTGPITFTGTLGGLTAYTMRGTDKTILRRKWGPTKEDIKTKSQYDITRRNNREFAARAKGASAVQRVLQLLKPIGDHNLAGPLNGLMSTLLPLDTEGAYGRRALLLSREPWRLEGVALGRQSPFDAVLRAPVEVSLSRAGLRAEVELPALVPGVNFFPPGAYPLCRVVAVLGLVPDLFIGNDDRYAPEAGYRPLFPARADTEWFAARSGAPATTLTLALEGDPGVSSFSLLLAVGIGAATLERGGNARPVRYAGAGKILAAG